MSATVSKGLLVALTVTATLAAACSSGGSESAPLQTGKGRRFVPQVVDTQGNIGTSPWVNLDADGNPVITYLGFPDVPKEGEIPETRTIDFPLVPAVLTATVNSGAWSLSAVEEQAASLVTEKGDAQVPVANASAQSAVGKDGSVHIVYVDSEGLQYASGTGGTFTTQTIAKGKDISGPSITLDGSGVPWVSYYEGGTVWSATVNGTRWVTALVDKTGTPASGSNLRTAITWADAGPVVGYFDKDPMAATLPADLKVSTGAWTVGPIEKTAGGLGMALATDSDGNPVASYLSADGSVKLATGGGTWAVETVAQAKPSPLALATTDVAVDDSGTRWITYFDAGTDAVRLVSSTASGQYVTIDTPGTQGGSMPSVASTADGESVWLAWYDHSNSNLMAGDYAAQQVQLAVRSPAPVGVVAPPAGGGTSAPASAPPASAAPTEGGGGKGVTLTIAAPVGAVSSGFDKTALSAPADTPITIEFDNQDSGVPHNVEVKSTDGSTALFNGEIITGPAKSTYQVGPLSAGQYPFICSVHPTTMTGTLTVK